MYGQDVYASGLSSSLQQNWAMKNCGYIHATTKLLNKQLVVVSCRSANLLIAPQLHLKLFSRGNFSLLLTVKWMVHEKRFLFCYFFSELENNAGTIKQIQYSLDFFKMSKTKNIQLMPKAILEILKVLALEKMSFSYKGINFHMSPSQDVFCPLYSGQMNFFKGSSNQIFYEKISGTMTPTTFL